MSGKAADTVWQCQSLQQGGELSQEQTGKETPYNEVQTDLTTKPCMESCSDLCLECQALILVSTGFYPLVGSSQPCLLTKKADHFLQTTVASRPTIYSAWLHRRRDSWGPTNLVWPNHLILWPGWLPSRAGPDPTLITRGNVPGSSRCGSDRVGTWLPVRK